MNRDLHERRDDEAHGEARDALDRQLDDRLRAAFAPPPAAELAARARRALEGTGRRPRLHLPLLLAAAAAAMLAVAVAGPRLLRPVGDGRVPEGSVPDGHEVGALWAAAWQDATARGFDPSCCRTGVDLPACCRAAFSVPLALLPDAAVKLCGSYCGLPTGGGLMFLLHCERGPVCVCVLPRDRDPSVRLPHGSGLQLARREVGPLVLYALAPERRDELLEEFVVPAQ